MERFILLVFWLFLAIPSYSQISLRIADDSIKRHVIPNRQQSLLKRHLTRFQWPSRTELRQTQADKKIQLLGLTSYLTNHNGTLIDSSMVSLKYLQDNQIKETRLYMADTTISNNYIMDPSYTWTDVLDHVNPGGYNGYFIRPHNGRFYGSYLKEEGYQKIQDSWQKIAYSDNRIELPFGYRYGDTWSVLMGCPKIWEQSVHGGVVDGLWNVVLDVEMRYCESPDDTQNWREKYIYNNAGKILSLQSSKKVNDIYIEEQFSEYRYDEVGREVESIRKTPTAHVKITARFDEVGNPIEDLYRNNGTTWVHMAKTLELGSETQNNETIYRYIRQTFQNDQWINQSRYTYGYDNEMRVILMLKETWNASDSIWEFHSHIKWSYYPNDILASEEIVDRYSGYRTLWDFNAKAMLSGATSYQCEGNNCLKNIFTPDTRSRYNFDLQDTTDTWAIDYYQNNTWVPYDSIANTYDADGKIRGMYHHNLLESKERRITFRYNTDVITSREDDNQISFDVYPNPFSNVLNIKTDQTRYSISFINSLGTVLFNENNSKILSVEKFPPGVYFVKIREGDRVLVRKLIKR